MFLKNKNDNVLIDCDTFTVTKREALVSIIIVVLLMGIGIYTTSSIINKVDEHNSKVNRIQCCDTQDMFDHLVDTNAGKVIAKANVVCTKPVAMNDIISGEYSYIYYQREKYEMKTRVVTDTYTDADGNTHTSSHTETYYEWDTKDWESKSSDEITINNHKYKPENVSKYFPYKYLSAKDYKGKYSYESGNYIYLSSHERISFKVYELTSAGVVYCKLDNNKIDYVRKYYLNKTSPKEVKKSMLKNANSVLAVFWIIDALLILGVVFVFVYFDNDWLYGKKEEKSFDEYDW